MTEQNPWVSPDVDRDREAELEDLANPAPAGSPFILRAPIKRSITLPTRISHGTETP